MRRYMVLMLTGVFLLTASHGLWAGEAKKAGKATIEGTLVDMACYFDMDASGAKHAQCAAKCARSGIPMGVLKKGTSEVYTLLAPSLAVADYAEQTVRVTGTVRGYVISPEKFEALKDGKWKEVKLPDTM